MTENRPGPGRTGCVEPFKRADGTTYYRARIRLADDSRVRVDVPPQYATPAGGMSGRERAELYAAALQEREDETGELLEKRAKVAPGAGTVSPWFGEYYKAAERGAVGRKNRGKPQSSIDARRSRFETWIEPAVGALPMASVTAADLRRIVQQLDEAVLRRRLVAIYSDSSILWRNLRLLRVTA